MWSILLALLCALSAAHEVRGVTVSCPTSGWEWGSDAMVDTLSQLDQLGANWVAIHPYAQVSADGSVDWRAIDPQHPPTWLSRPIAEAHARGLRVLIKPHLAYWGSAFSWRGDVHFDGPQERARFFSEYQAWVTVLAFASRDADAFVVATELDRTVMYDSEWRAVIASVRGVFAGHLTYAANWDSYQRVPFWDALDVVGVQAYFPLLRPGQRLTAQALDTSWSAIMADIAAFSAKVERPVVFTELGYPRASNAAVQPWRAVDHANQEDAQIMCLDAALRAVEAEPAVVGAFLWKWFPGDTMPRDFALQREGPRRVMAEHWGSGG